jgi:hypothetical protein
VEGSAHTQLYIREAKHLRPKCVGEDKVMIADDGARDTIQFDDVVEEDLGDGDNGVRVAQWDEVDILREAIHHRKDHRFPADTWETLHKVHGDVGPHRARQLEGVSNPIGWRCLDLLR